MKYVWLIIPCLIAIAVPIYNSVEPKLAGFPLFFCLQLGLIPVSSIFILLAYLWDKQ
jgi:hypothetical protein